MANLKSSKKSIRKTERETLRNRTVKSKLKTLAKAVVLAKGEDKEKLKMAAKNYISALDKAAKCGIIHCNKASRHKSSMAKLLATS